jgi:trk system potassium uptake protein TrkA
MKVVILGCGRLGAKLAQMLDSEGDEVTVMDPNSESFARLGPRFRGRTVVGVGIDEDALRRADIEKADAFVALTDGDNTNIMASQIAQIVFKVPRVISQIKDPIREDTYHLLGLDTICPTTLGAEVMKEVLLRKS